MARVTKTWDAPCQLWCVSFCATYKWCWVPCCTPGDLNKSKALSLFSWYWFNETLWAAPSKSEQSFGHRVIFLIYSFISQPGLWVHDLVPHKRGRHWSGLHVLHLPRLSDLKMWTRRMESNVPKASWQEMSRRDMHLQRPSHRQGFVGRFLHCSGSSLSGLAVSSCASNSKTPEEENQVIQSIQRLTPLLHGEQFPSSCGDSYK